jgi:hypothetical protein
MMPCPVGNESDDYVKWKDVTSDGDSAMDRILRGDDPGTSSNRNHDETGESNDRP